MVNEETIFCKADIPAVPGYVWHADLNVVELSEHLDIEGRIAAVTELTRQWRRDHLSLVVSA